MEQNQSKNYDYSPIQVVLYFVLTFLISWSFMIPWARDNGGEGSLALPCAGYGPFLAALIVVGFSKGRTGLLQWLGKAFRLRIPVILYLAGAFLFPLLVGGLQYGLYLGLGGEPDFSTANPWNLYAANVAVIFLLYGGNEEPGWRGFALPALLERFHPLLASIILGVIHAAWHLPMMTAYGTTFGWYLFNVIPLTVIFNWFYLKSRGSVIPVMLLHAGVNAIGNYIPTPMVVLGGFGTEMFLTSSVYWVMAIVIIIFTRGRLGTDSNNTQFGD